jgi:tetratricopeptide (TPR) repeat protein
MSFLIDFKILVIPILKRKTSKPSKPQPQVENIENFIVVWLDNSKDKNKDHQTSKSQLQQVVNTVKIFTDSNECQTFMSAIKDEKIFMIVSGTIEENFVSSVHDAKQLESIYVLSPDKKTDQSWFNQYPEIHGVHINILSLCEQLNKDVKMADYFLLGFEVMEQSSSNTTSKANQQEALFMYDQLFRDIVFTVQDENMQDIYEYCEKQYRRNLQAQQMLKVLKQNYSSNSAIFWYSQESFLYRMLNKALRTHQYDMLYLLRVFIRHLHEQIVAKQQKDDIDEQILFRGQAMEKEDFERLRISQGGLLCFSSFLSTSSDREVGLYFARQALKDRRKVSILMEITVYKSTSVPVANITNFSAYKTEQEWLFSIGSVFRIGSLELLPDGIWLVHLTLTNDQDEQLSALKEHFKKSMTDQNTCFSFARLMYQLAAWRKSEYFYLMALETETTWQRRSTFYNNLAMVKGELNQYDQALAYYNKSLELKQTAGSDSVSDNATTYNNIGALYYKQKKMDRAIEYFQKAIEVCNAQGNNDEGLKAILHCNIANILNDQGKYEEALKKCEESLEIEKRILPPIHPSIASTYGIMANIKDNMGLHEEAIKYMENALSIDRQALPPDHPQIALHMTNLEVFKQRQQQQQQSH